MQFEKLRNELEIWHDEGLELPIWWRDDDAVAESKQLERLTRLSANFNLPVHLAVIPGLLEPSLPKFVHEQSNLRILVHGWRHHNHARAGKKCEFGIDRSLALRKNEAKNGLEKILMVFADQADPVFVPPWNRIAEDMIPHLAEMGYQSLSRFTPRAFPFENSKLQIVNTHLDVIDWRGTRSAIDDEVLQNRAVEILHDRRTGKTDNQEPLGILSHHLVHDDAIWSMTAHLLDAFLSGPVKLTCPFATNQS